MYTYLTSPFPISFRVPNTEQPRLLKLVGPLLGNDLETMKQHPLLGNRFLISKFTQPLLSNAFTKKHVPTATIGVQKLSVFYAVRAVML
jgi:hypothetical protein